jgi:RNA polymerase sigma-70 factor (ECF subfamily)
VHFLDLPFNLALGAPTIVSRVPAIVAMGELRHIRPDPAPEELDLVEACRRGDREAMRAVFLAHSPYLERLLGRVAGSSFEVEDLLQTTFVAAISAFPRFRGEAQVRTWLARIAVRTAQERLRSAAHRKRAQLTGLEDRADPRTDHTRAEGDIDARRKLERLNAHLLALGAKKRVAFVLHVFEGHPLEEVAALTGSSLAATKSRVFWARRELLRRAARDPLLRGLAQEVSS